jgi:hypothetical protein
VLSVPGGAVTLKIKDLKIGKKISMVQVELMRKAKDGKLSTCTTAIVT